jgi:hypothetical protein
MMIFGQKLMKAKKNADQPTAHGPGVVLLLVIIFTICAWAGPTLF